MKSDIPTIPSRLTRAAFNRGIDRHKIKKGTAFKHILRGELRWVDFGVRRKFFLHATKGWRSTAAP